MAGLMQLPRSFGRWFLVLEEFVDVLCQMFLVANLVTTSKALVTSSDALVTSSEHCFY